MSLDSERIDAPQQDARPSPGSGVVWPTVPGAGKWVMRSVPLKVSLGERSLFWVRFDMAVREVHFSELVDDEYCNFAAWDSIPPSVDAVLIRSQPVSAELPRRARIGGAVRYVPAQYLRYYMEFGGTFAEYLQKFSSKIRSNRKREVKKFAEFSGGTIDFRAYRTVAEVGEFLTIARELSRKTFQERLLDAGLPGDDAYRQHQLELASQDRVRAYLMFHSGKPVAYLLTEVSENGILLYRYLGYDPEFRSWSPGTVLHCQAFEQLFAENRFRFLDFTEGEGTHKKFFATGHRACADLIFFRPTLRNRVFLLVHSLMEAFSRTASAVLDKLGLKARIKKLMRAWA